jgi:hypothetical protein
VGPALLDVVRYADTSGFEHDLYLRNAWRYRDYVIASFNADKPYDQFVKEQIAADEIWPDDNELEGSYILPKKKEIDVQRRIGTSMYTVGPIDPESFLDGAHALRTPDRHGRYYCGGLPRPFHGMRTLP